MSLFSLFKTKNSKNKKQLLSAPEVRLPQNTINRFVKIGSQGEKLSNKAPQWAAVLDTRSNLMWLTNLSPQHHFPVEKVTWYFDDDKFCQKNYSQTFNNGNNTQKAIELINQKGWCSYHDWRMPTYQEMHALIEVHEAQFDDQYARNKVHHEALFNDDKYSCWVALANLFKWTEQYGSIVDLYNGSRYTPLKQQPQYMRLVRNA